MGAYHPAERPGTEVSDNPVAITEELVFEMERIGRHGRRVSPS